MAKKYRFLSKRGGKRHQNGMETQNTTENPPTQSCCTHTCARLRCAKLALGMVNTTLLAALTAAVAVLCCKHSK